MKEKKLGSGLSNVSKAKRCGSLADHWWLLWCCTKVCLCKCSYLCLCVADHCVSVCECVCVIAGAGNMAASSQIPLRFIRHPA